MLDTVGPELQVLNRGEGAISLQEDVSVILTPDQGQVASSEVLPINFGGLAKVGSAVLCFRCKVFLNTRLICSVDHVLLLFTFFQKNSLACILFPKSMPFKYAFAWD